MAVKYSPTESALLKLLPVNGDHITVRELAEKYYKAKKREMPLHGEQYISNAMRMLELKMKKNRAKPKIKRTESERPIHFWME